MWKRDNVIFPQPCFEFSGPWNFLSKQPVSNQPICVSPHSWVCPPECKLGTSLGRGRVQWWGGAVGGSVNWWKYPSDTWTGGVECPAWVWEATHSAGWTRVWREGGRPQSKDSGLGSERPALPGHHRPDVTPRSQRTLNLNPASILLIKLCLSWRVEHILYLFKNVQVWIITFKYLSTWHVGLHLHNDPGPTNVGYISAPLPSRMFSYLTSEAMEAFQGCLNAMGMWSIKKFTLVLLHVRGH